MDAGTKERNDESTGASADSGQKRWISPNRQNCKSTGKGRRERPRPSEGVSEQRL